jgi:tripartite-type tricarboxylate transporter receptor subunit TctC
MAQAYPSRSVRIIAPISAGGTQDILARLIGSWLSERFGQSFFTENRPGGGNNIGTEVAVRAPADGYTLLLASTANAVNATLYDKLNFDFIRDIAPIASIARFPFVMTVHPSVPAKSVPEFIAYAKSEPGKINMASAGTGTVPHIAGELFNMLSGVRMVHVPYRGGAPAMTDLLAGQVQVYFVTTASSVEYVKAGKLRALAVTATTRYDGLPDVPTLNEFLPGYEANVWFGLGAPNGTPPEIIDKLNSETNAGLADAKIKSRIAELGGTALTGSPAEFGNLVAHEVDKWAKVIRAASIKAD